MRVAFFSPLPPIKSGIADYSAELLPALKKKFGLDEIDVYVDGFKVVDERLTNVFAIYPIKEYWKNKQKNHYDMCIYQIGNNHHYHGAIYSMALIEPGLVVLHDISIHLMIVGLLNERGNLDNYLEEMKYNHGAEGENVAREFKANKGVPPWESKDVLKYPMNKRLIDQAKGVIVHSQFARKYIKDARRDVPVKVVNLHAEVVQSCEGNVREEARQRLGIETETLVLASFGYISPNRRIYEVLKALQVFRETNPEPIRYYLVGEINDPTYKVKELIHILGLDDIVIMTGYVDMTLYMEIMEGADLCLNLRYPSYGESSANLHRMLGLGKVVLVSDVGTFKEYPEAVVIRIKVGSEVNELPGIFRKIIKDSSWKRKISNNALAFASEFCSIERAANDYYNFIENISNGLGQIELFLEDAAETLINEVALEDDDIRLKALALQVMEAAKWTQRKENEGTL